MSYILQNLEEIKIKDDVADRWSISNKVPANLTEQIEFFNIELDEWMEYVEKHGELTLTTEYVDDNFVDAIIISSDITNSWLKKSRVARKFDKQTGKQVPV